MKELKIGEWYYRMMGYGGGDSRYCCIRRKVGEKTPSGMMSLFGGKDGGIKVLPVTDLFEAVLQVFYKQVECPFGRTDKTAPLPV